MSSAEEKTVLVVGHPGHELRIFHWLEITRPTVFVITDGSGQSGQSRLPSTTRILEQVGAARGSFYGPLTDRAAYAALLDHNFELFNGLTYELARYLVDHNVSGVAGDAWEGYNPIHDTCRLMIGAAAEMVQRSTQRVVQNLAFVLTGRPDSDEPSKDGPVRLDLDNDAFARKMLVARGYAELESEVGEAINQNRLDAFRVECLRRVSNNQALFAVDHKPYYEQLGEHRVSAGAYPRVIRYREHVLPLAESLWRLVDTVDL
jgi:hypothetical protein